MLRVGQQPLECGVLPLQVPEPFGVVGVHPAELVAPPVVCLLGDLQLTADVSDVLALVIRSAVASLRTTCSGVCFFLVAMLMSSLPAHNVGRKTLKRPGSTSRGQATSVCSPARTRHQRLPNRGVGAPSLGQSGRAAARSSGVARLPESRPASECEPPSSAGSRRTCRATRSATPRGRRTPDHISAPDEYVPTRSRLV